MLDVDGDGRRDVALAGPAGVEVLYQTAAGTLANGPLLPDTAGARLVVADAIDGDGADDLVVDTDAGVMLLTHQPDGSFVSQLVSSDHAGSVAAGDLNGDGRVDIATVRQGQVYIYHHTDTGWPRTDLDIAYGYPFHSGIEVADVDNDGRADLITSIARNSPNARINVFRQGADGTLGQPDVYPTVDIPEPVEAADLNGDGRLDVVVAHGGWSTLSVLLQNSGGTLNPAVPSPIPYASHYSGQGVAIGDIDGDDRHDVVIADYNNGLVVLRQTPGPVVGGEQAWVSGVGPADFATSVGVGTVPQVVFQRSLDPTSVTAQTVRLLHGRTGATVATTPTYNATTRTVTLAHATPLQRHRSVTWTMCWRASLPAPPRRPPPPAALASMPAPEPACGTRR